MRKQKKRRNLPSKGISIKDSDKKELGKIKNIQKQNFSKKYCTKRNFDVFLSFIRNFVTFFKKVPFL